MTPLFERIVQEYPCPRHGDPRILTPTSAAWIGFYNFVAPYAIKTDIRDKDKTYEYPLLPISLIRELCEAFDIDFFEALRLLNLIHEGTYGHLERPLDRLFDQHTDAAHRRETSVST